VRFSYFFFFLTLNVSRQVYDMTQTTKLAEFMAICRKRVAGELRDDPYSRMFYSTDASLYQIMPYAVLIPRTAEDVVAAVATAAEFGVPVLARGAGTSLAGQAVNEALIIDFTRHLDQVVEVNAEERWARVQPGVVVDDLNAALRPLGLQFGPDPASADRSTLGGVVANNATGSHSLLYGMTADHVRAMEMVLADGRVVTAGAGMSMFAIGHDKLRVVNGLKQLIEDPTNQKTITEETPHYWRRCGGYNLDRLLPGAGQNLAQLICGSEGTLAVMTEITVGLVPRPPHKVLGLVHFDDLALALETVPAILETGPTAVELLDTLSLTLCRGVATYARMLASVIEGRPHCLLVVEYQGESEAEALDGLSRLERRLSAAGPVTTGLTRATTVEAMAAVWGVRKAGLGLLMSMKGDMKPVPFIEDAAVPVECLPEYVRRIEMFCGGLDTPITYYAHAGAGCLHIRPLVNRRSAAQIAQIPDIARFAAELVKGYGGALSSEHGDGRSRSWLNEAFYGPRLYDLFRQVKRIFDPDNLLNPGIIVDAGSMLENWRAIPASPGPARTDFGDYEIADTIPLRVASSTTLTSHPTDGFVHAVEMCNGAGVCRRQTGTMCPSFMVTRDEEHSTRGRANALRAAMSGVLPASELTSPRMAKVMELCISCKACKAECPSAVDMARIKTEFLARYYEVHGVGLRSRFFGHAAALNRVGSGWRAPLTNVALRSRIGHAVGHRLLGLAPQRSLPEIARTPFETWWRKRAGPTTARPVATIVLLIDPFTNYNHPEVGIAAVEFFEAIGVEIIAAPALDDGRACLSKGLVADARRAAERAVAALAPWVKRGLPVVGLEPSGLLTLRDEYLHLLPGDDRACALAGHALTFEEFVDGLAEGHDLRPFFANEPRHVLLHGHCHQKALVGTGPARRVLALPGYHVTEVDSGCCGMAGSFGYEAEHYELSMQMGERRLLPAVRETPPETIIATAGVSCRQQIAHGSGRTALHPAQVLRRALRSKP